MFSTWSDQGTHVRTQSTIINAPKAIDSVYLVKLVHLYKVVRLDLCSYKATMQFWFGQGESYCLIKTKHCDGW